VEGVGVSAFAGRPVLVTGHTGFKGTWLCLWLKELGAEVHGYALPPPTAPSLSAEVRLSELLASEVLADVREAAQVEEAIRRVRPVVVFHLAAQPIVRRSYREPRLTWATNVLGTVNVLEAVRVVPGVQACLVITSDKCYENPGQVCAFRETDPMGGHDPYSASKGAAEVAVAAWRRSFFAPDRFPDHGVCLASARAGNVIGGGDWAEDRIIPDCIRALSRHEPVTVRHPGAVRPWQHVLEPLSGYLRLAEAQLAEPQRFADSFNFGPLPSGTLTVGQVADLVVQCWGSGRWEHRPPTEAAPRDRLHEDAFLKLDITKAATLLGWEPVLTPRQAVAETVAWYRQRDREGPAFDARAACRRQIAAYRERRTANG
jgi:CDP-glucose 4,6-dehydratase